MGACAAGAQGLSTAETGAAGVRLPRPHEHHKKGAAPLACSYPFWQWGRVGRFLHPLLLTPTVHRPHPHSIVHRNQQRRLPATLCEALGPELAWEIVPRSFMLPDELSGLAAWSAAHPEAAKELWILKTAQHLGKGLTLVPLEAAAAEAGKPRRRCGGGSEQQLAKGNTAVLPGHVWVRGHGGGADWQAARHGGLLLSVRGGMQ